jgi:hypothetical protein
MILGFNEDFIPAIKAGTKVHTIREGQRWQAGNTAEFYARAQAPDRYEFWEPLPVLLVQEVELTTEGLLIDGRLLSPAELLTLAQADGFATAEGLLAFFADKPLPLRGQLVHWTNLRY